MSNEANIRKYRWLSRVYDRTVDNRWFERARQREFELARIQPHHRVLLIGVGTGLDIPYMPAGAEVVGIDISPEMLERARRKEARCRLSLYEMSAEELRFEDRSFDVIVMNLILSVLPNPREAMREASRVLAPSGSIWILGKFVESKAGTLRKALSRFTTAVGGASLVRSLDEIIGDAPLQKRYEEAGTLADIIQLTQTGRGS